MKAMIGTGLAVAILIVLAVVPVAASAEIPQRYTDAWQFTEADNWIVSNACSGEDVQLTGTFHDQLIEVFDAAGGYHWVNHWRAQGKGVGVDSGAQYVFKGGDQKPVDPGEYGGFHVWSDQGLRYESTSTWYLNLIGQGQVPDSRIRCIAHTTVNANGEMATEFTRCWVSCN